MSHVGAQKVWLAAKKGVFMQPDPIPELEPEELPMWAMPRRVLNPNGSDLLLKGPEVEPEEARQTTPERRLLLAMLISASQDAIGRGAVFGGLYAVKGMKKILASQARGWITSEGDVIDERGFSFVAVCNALGFDVEATRRAALDGRLDVSVQPSERIFTDRRAG